MGDIVDEFDEWNESEEDDLVKILEQAEATVSITTEQSEKCHEGLKQEQDGEVKSCVIENGSHTSNLKKNWEDSNTTCEPHSIVTADLPSLEPLRAFRPGYLWVSDFSSQHWCEQKLHYSFTLPCIVEENPAMTEGSNLHLARELAAHDKVDVKVTSNEDIWAIKVVNLLTSVQAFLNGQSIAREVPVFGAPFDQDVFIVGLIDELRFDIDNYSIDLSDLKTRMVNHLPSKSQQDQHHLQVMLYKKLFDDLVQGGVRKDLIAKHLRLNLDKQFGEGIQGHLSVNGFDCKNLNQLLDYTFHRLQSCTCINRLSIEYVYQETKATILDKAVDYNEVNLRFNFLRCLDYWKGRRPPQGVEIEEAWKCQRCDFVDVCEWRERKATECAERNKRKTKEHT